MTQEKNNLATIQARFPDSRLTSFGDNAALSEYLLARVRSGEKTATCSALRDYETEGETPSVAGETQIVLDHTGAPALVIRIDGVEIKRYDAVDRAFAIAEGEGDYPAWDAAHRRFFGDNGGWSVDMLVVCERFHLVADLAMAADSP